MTVPAIEIALDARAAVGEGITWCDRRNVLWWVDIPAGEVHCFDPASGRDKSWPVGEPVGCLGLSEGEDLVLGLKSGFAGFSPATGRVRPIVDPERDRPGNRLNDGAVSRDGRFFAGSMPMGAREPAQGALYRLDPDGRSTLIRSGLHVSNGLAFSPDNRTLYLSDSYPSVRTIWAHDYDPDDGTIGAARLFFDTRTVAGRPDGGCVDSDGCYWMAGVGGGELVRLTPYGAVDRRIDLPVEKPTKPCFAGPALDILFVTSIRSEETDPAKADGAILAVRTGYQGLPEGRMPRIP